MPYTRNLNRMFNLIKKISSKVNFPTWLWITLGVLITIRLILPVVGFWGINWALSHKMGTYDGHIEGFSLSLYRGAYQLEGLQIRKKNSSEPALLAIDEIDLSIAWRTLFLREINTDVTIQRAVIHLIDSQSKEKKQLGNDEPGWKSALDVIIPINVESLKIHTSEIYFSNYDFSKSKPLKISKIELTAEDLRSRAHNPAEALSPFTLSGILEEHAVLKASGKIDFLAKLLRADIHFSLVKFHPKTVNEMLLAYLPLDLTKGELSIYSEAAASQGQVKGYANVFLKDVEVIAPKQHFLSVKHFLIEIISAFINWLLQNNKDKTVAAHIPFSRNHGKFDIGASEAFWSAVQNKTKELKPGFENSINLLTIEGKKIPK